jgi:hypothetical protein
MPAKKTPDPKAKIRHHISVDLKSEKQKEDLVKLAKASRLSISAYMRELAQYAIDEEIEFETKLVRKPK